MFFLRTLIILVFSTPAFAEHKTEPNQVYDRSSKLSVDNINKVTEIFRDPTQLSGNFRQVINTLKSDSGTDIKGTKIPQIKLIAKVFVPKSLNTSSPINNLSSVALKVDDQVHYLKEGAMSSIIIKEHLLTIHVEEITQYYVKLIVQPGNETLVLH